MLAHEEVGVAQQSPQLEAVDGLEQLQPIGELILPQQAQQTGHIPASLQVPQPKEKQKGPLTLDQPNKLKAWTELDPTKKWMCFQSYGTMSRMPMIPSTEETSIRRQLPTGDPITKVQAKLVAFNGTKTDVDRATTAPTAGVLTVTAALPTTTTATTETPGSPGTAVSKYGGVVSLLSEGKDLAFEDIATKFFCKEILSAAPAPTSTPGKRPREIEQIITTVNPSTSGIPSKKRRV